MDLPLKYSITPSLVLEYLYCPRFIYYMEVLRIPQHQETRFKVLQGRKIHKIKALTNLDYKRKKLNVTGKLINQEVHCEQYQIHGIVDEILFMEDGKAAPLDYKYAQYKDKVYKTYKIQSAMYALMIMDNYQVTVNKGYLVYTRSKNKLVEIEFEKKDFDQVIKITGAIQKIVMQNYFPARTRVKSRCFDCCYKNICIQ